MGITWAHKMTSSHHLHSAMFGKKHAPLKIACNCLSLFGFINFGVDHGFLKIFIKIVIKVSSYNSNSNYAQ